ncbi:AzlC family ABC transporter permease [Nakamurella sp. GG22]
MNITTDDGTAQSDAPASNLARREMLRGAAAMAPITVGYLPFGLLLGAAVGRCIDPLAAWAGTGLLYGGSAHLTVVELIHTGSGAAAAVGAALLINLRLLVFGTALAPLWGTARPVAKMLAAAAVIDPTWMLAERRAAEPGGLAERRAHYAGASICLTVGWTVAVTAGALLGSFDHLAQHLSIAVTLCLTAIVAPHVRVPGGFAAVGAATGVALVGRSWPPGTGILAAMAAAALAGSLVAMSRSGTSRSGTSRSGMSRSARSRSAVSGSTMSRSARS